MCSTNLQPYRMMSRKPRTEPDASVLVFSGSGSGSSSDPDCPAFTIQYTGLMQNHGNNTGGTNIATSQEPPGRWADRQPCTATDWQTSSTAIIHHHGPPARDQVNGFLERDLLALLFPAGKLSLVHIVHILCYSLSIPSSG